MSSNVHLLCVSIWIVLVIGQRPPAGNSLNNSDQCPCVRPSSGGGCIGYNPRYQAATLEEAVINFVDLTSQDPEQATNIYGLSPVQYVEDRNQKRIPLHCNTVECLACFQVLNERLTAQWRGSREGTAGLGLGLSRLAPYNVNGALTTDLATRCRRLNPRGKDNRSRDQPFSHGNDSVISEEEAAFSDDEVAFHEENRRRKRAKQLKNIGVNTKLDCSFKRGSPSGDNSGYVGLCNLCWSMRTLSPKYFPRYVNELSCHPKDFGCLNGWGKCREKYRSIDVLYNSGTDAKPKWKQYSINSPVSCECQVMAGSGLHNFVSA